MNIFIYHHLGLGDHIICNGLVRELYSRNVSNTTNIFLFCKIINYNSVAFMYRDLHKLIVLPIPNDNLVKKYVIGIKEEYGLIKIGFEKRKLNEKYFDQDFYRIINIPFEHRWSKFFLKRDYESEKRLFNELNLTTREYVFIHDDSVRGFKIDRKYIVNKDLTIITPHMTKNIFDWCMVLENAKELHCIDSSFRLIADSISLRTTDLFFHYSYINKDKRYLSSSKYPWKII